MDKEHKEMLKEIKNSQIIVRKPLSDADKFQILKQYSEGVPVSDIAKTVSRDTKETSEFIQSILKDMSSIKETNELLNVKCSADFKRLVLNTSPTKFLTSDFLSKVEEKAEVYAYYFSQTGDNKFSLEQSGLDIGIIN